MIALFRERARRHDLATQAGSDSSLARIDEAAALEPGERMASVMLPPPSDVAVAPSIEAMLARLARHDSRAPMPRQRVAG